MKHFIWILFVFVSLSCKQETATSIPEKPVDTSVLIEGKINGYDSENWANEGVYALTNYMEASREETKFKIDSLGNYRLEFSVDHPTDIYIYNGYSMSLLVHPGDRMTTVFEAVKNDTPTFLKNAVITGDHALENKAFLSYISEIQFTYKTYEDQEKLKRDTPEVFKRHLDSISTLKENIIDKYLAQSTEMPSLTNWLKAEKLIYRKSQIMSYVGMYSMFTRQTPEISDTFYDGIEPFEKITEPLLINSNLSDQFSNEYLFHIRSAVAKANPELLRKSEAFNPLFTREMIDRNKNNPLLAQLMVSRWAHMGFNQMNVSYYENQRTIVDSLLMGTQIGELLTTRYNTTKERIDNPVLPEGTELLSFTAQSAEDYLKEIIANANGKVVYIDNWATWCGPCREEFKESTPALKAKFSKDVEFIYLCHQSDEKLWKPTISEFKVDGKHYFLDKDESKPLFKQFDLQGFPTYTIINKKGEIVNSGFEFRPSEAITTKILNELIAE